MALPDYLWTIGAAIYVGGMLPMFYFYQFIHDNSFSAIDLIATVGAFLVLAQMFYAAIPKELTPEKIQNQKEKGAAQPSPIQ